MYYLTKDIESDAGGYAPTEPTVYVSPPQIITPPAPVGPISMQLASDEPAVTGDGPTIIEPVWDTTQAVPNVEPDTVGTPAPSTSEQTPITTVPKIVDPNITDVYKLSDRLNAGSIIERIETLTSKPATSTTAATATTEETKEHKHMWLWLLIAIVVIIILIKTLK